jgi:hypothetical protein
VCLVDSTHPRESLQLTAARTFPERHGEHVRHSAEVDAASNLTEFRRRSFPDFREGIVHSRGDGRFQPSSVSCGDRPPGRSDSSEPSPDPRLRLAPARRDRSQCSAVPPNGPWPAPCGRPAPAFVSSDRRATRVPGTRFIHPGVVSHPSPQPRRQQTPGPARFRCRTFAQLPAQADRQNRRQSAWKREQPESPPVRGAGSHPVATPIRTRID